MQNRYLVVVILGLWAALTKAQDSTVIRLPDPGVLQQPAGYVPHDYPARPRLSLALSGGGSRGFAHIGVIKALVEAGIPIEGIAGTSIGAVVGGLYAAGYSIQELEAIAKALDWGEIFRDAPPQKTLPLSSKSSASDALVELQFTGTKPHVPPALSAGQRLSAFLVDKVNRAPYCGEADFDHLRLPFRAVSVNLKTGERVLFSRGDLSEALLASMALPLLIAPLNLDGQLLIDGGVAENIPVRAARDLGDVVLAVNATQAPYLGLPPYEPWVIANQVTTLMQRALYEDLLKEADLIITPVPDTLGNLSFANISFLIQAGYQATLKQIPELQRKLESRPWDQDSSPVRARCVEIRFTENAPLLTDLQTAFLSQSLTLGDVAAGHPIERRQVLRDLEFLQKDDRCQEVWAQLRNDTLRFWVAPNPLLKSVRIAGVTQLLPAELFTHLQADTGKIIAASASAARLEEILQAYRNLGNPLARLVSVVLDDGGQLTINVDEGRVRSLETEGQRRFSPRRILRDFNITVNQSLSLNDLRAGMDELYGSGLFSTVRATCINDTVVIKVVENPLPQVRLGAGFDSERNGRGFAELSYAALPGIGGTLTTRAHYAEMEENYSIGYRNLAIFQTYLEGAGSLESARTEYHYYLPTGQSEGQYYFDRLGASVHLGEQFRTWGRVVFGLRWDRIRTNQASSPVEQELRRFFLRSEIDTQDRAEFPSSGRRYELQLEAAVPALKGDVSFNRISFQLKNVQSLTHRFTAIFRLRGGICDESTPFSEWFRLGGEQSFLGLHEGEKAGRQLFSLRLELREDLISRFLADAYLSIYGDMGSLWENLEADLTLRDFLYGSGISLALDTFLGPVSLTYGYLFETVEHPGRQQWYFNLGHRF